MLYRRFMPVVYRYVLARVGTVPATEDVTSETFFAVIDGIQSMRAHDELTFAAWVLGIARNKVAMHFRRLRPGEVEPESLLEEDEHPKAIAQAGDPLGIVTAKESWEEVVVALSKLTQDQQAVVLYRCVLGYSTDEVAELLQKQPNAVRVLQFRALASLARHLGIERESREPSRIASWEGGKD
jgi:RNA polymerase sigma-70 factor (ECF subfamily)